MTKKNIGIVQLITGIFGVIYVLFSALMQGSAVIKSQQAIMVIVVGTLLYGLLAWAGYALLYNLKNAKRYSMFLQAIQIPQLAITGILYKFTSTGFISLGFIKGKPNFDFSLQLIQFEISPNLLSEQTYAIYIIPLIMLYALIRMK